MAQTAAKPRPTKEGRVTLRKLGEMIDRLGELRLRKGELETPERELTEQVQSALSLLKVPGAEGRRFAAVIDVPRWLEIDPAKFVRRFGEAALKECCFIKTKKAREMFPHEDLDALGEFLPHPKLRVTARPGK